MPSKLWNEFLFIHAVEVWEWISNFILNFLMDVITYPFWYQSKTILVKRALGVALDHNRDYLIYQMSLVTPI